MLASLLSDLLRIPATLSRYALYLHSVTSVFKGIACSSLVVLFVLFSVYIFLINTSFQNLTLGFTILTCKEFNIAFTSKTSTKLENFLCLPSQLNTSRKMNASTMSELLLQSRPSHAVPFTLAKIGHHGERPKHGPPFSYYTGIMEVSLQMYESGEGETSRHGRFVIDD